MLLNKFCSFFCHLFFNDYCVLAIALVKNCKRYSSYVGCMRINNGTIQIECLMFRQLNMFNSWDQMSL